MHLTELFLVASCLFWEARSEGADGMQLVYDTISNRAADAGSRWPNSRVGVVLQPWQFSCFNADDKQPFPNPKQVSDWLAWIQAMRIAKRGVVVNTEINHYHVVSLGWPKSWGKERNPALVHKSHAFYSF